jgi:hypothetical protein
MICSLWHTRSAIHLAREPKTQEPTRLPAIKVPAERNIHVPTAASPPRSCTETCGGRPPPPPPRCTATAVSPPWRPAWGSPACGTTWCPAPHTPPKAAGPLDQVPAQRIACPLQPAATQPPKPSRPHTLRQSRLLGPASGPPAHAVPRQLPAVGAAAHKPAPLQSW